MPQGKLTKGAAVTTLARTFAVAVGGLRGLIAANSLGAQAKSRT